jgi:ADP-dependent NAD(P)H-hydrate dehydratase / NAD(P)H-hydrate epimerase
METIRDILSPEDRADREQLADARWFCYPAAPFSCIRRMAFPMPEISHLTLPANDPALWRGHLPKRAAEDHKYTRGAAIVWSGPILRTGASRLAARAALQIGAGLVTLAGPKDALVEQAAQVTAIMLRPVETLGEWRALLSDARIRSIVIGPAAGVGDATRRLVERAAASHAGLVLDADALTSFAGDAAGLAEGLAHRVPATVLTPHEGEFSALFPELAGTREARASEAAKRLGACLVLKGHHTLIAAPDGRIIRNENAPSTLATAGSGDVLAGLIGGLIAQGMPGFEAAACGVWLHGEIGRLAGPHPIAEDFIAAIRSLPDFAAL